MHRKLEVWQKGMELANWIYDITKGFPAHEDFGITSQLRRAAVSIPANIAEGNSRKSQKDKAHFFNIARGSSCELETLILIAVKQGYARLLQDDPYEDRLMKLIRSVSAMLYRLEQSCA